jgi:hypothetical protein
MTTKLTHYRIPAAMDTANAGAESSFEKKKAAFSRGLRELFPDERCQPVIWRYWDGGLVAVPVEGLGAGGLVAPEDGAAGAGTPDCAL